MASSLSTLIDALDARVSPTVDPQLKQLLGQARDAHKAEQGEMQKLREQVAELQKAKAPAVDLTGIEDRLSQAEASLAALSAPPANAPKAVVQHVAAASKAKVPKKKS